MVRTSARRGSPPTFGRLFEVERWPSGVVLARDRFLPLAFEGEMAVRLGRSAAELIASNGVHAGHVFADTGAPLDGGPASLSMEIEGREVAAVSGPELTRTITSSLHGLPANYRPAGDASNRATPSLRNRGAPPARAGRRRDHRHHRPLRLRPVHYRVERLLGHPGQRVGLRRRLQRGNLTPALIRSQVSADTPASRIFPFCMRAVASVLGSASQIST